MESLDLTRKTWGVFGLKESGKSTMGKWIANEWAGDVLYYDTLHEVPASAPWAAYKPKDPYDDIELGVVVELFHRHVWPYHMLIIDEADRFFQPKPRPLQDWIKAANDWCRHPEYDLSIGYIARRPVNVNSDLVEVLDYKFFFSLTGKNDKAYLDSLKSGMGAVVERLPKYHCLMLGPGNEPHLIAPIKPPHNVVGSDTRHNP